MKRVQFLLVHGTFKPNAEWTMDNSPLALAIGDAFTESRIERFVWDGKNSIRSRGAAAAALSIKLAEMQTVQPDAPVVVIAHSHGGNIAFDAVASLPNDQSVAALVTLGTPFFTFLPRETGNATVYAMSLALGASALLYLAASAVLEHFGVQMGGIWLAATALFIWLTVSIRSKMSRSAERTNTWLEQLGRKSDLGDTPVLCIRFGLDEARLWLSVLSLARWLDKAIALRARKYLNLTKEKAGVAGVAVAILAFILFSPSIDAQGFFPTLLLHVVSLFVSIAAICVLLLALLSPLAVVASFIATHRYGFGGQPGFSALQFDLKIDTVPTSGSVYEKRFSTLFVLLRRLFAPNSGLATPHALGYTDRRSIAFLCKWVKDMLSFYRPRDDGMPGELVFELRALGYTVSREGLRWTLVDTQSGISYHFASNKALLREADSLRQRLRRDDA